MLRFAVLVAACSLVEGFAIAGSGAALAPRSLARTAAPVKMQLFGNKKTAEEILEEKGYWPGEWVCADCGYIYEPGTEPAFEELRQRWKCPQCAGPRRRFVKKAGGQYGQLDDSPVLVGTLALALFTVVFVVVGLNL